MAGRSMAPAIGTSSVSSNFQALAGCSGMAAVTPSRFLHRVAEAQAVAFSVVGPGWAAR